jgi:hypothetical protein
MLIPVRGTLIARPRIATCSTGGPARRRDRAAPLDRETRLAPHPTFGPESRSTLDA